MYVISQEQERECFKPLNWFFQDVPPEQKKTLLLNNQLWIRDNNFRICRNEVLRQRLSIVSKQLGTDGNDIISDIIRKTEVAENVNVCTQCGAENDQSYRTCRACGEGSLIRETYHDNQTQEENSSRVPDMFPSIQTFVNDEKIIIGEPDLRNRNSYGNICDILQNLGHRAGIKKYNDVGTRHWIYLEVDGTIYVIVKSLIENVFHCSTCSKWLHLIVSQSCQNHSAKKEFDWIILFPGLLHIEMNSSKVFVKLNWKVFMEAVAKGLGFKSENALKFAFKCSDHHKKPG